MNVIVLAAGRGSRMGSITEDMPKALVEIRPGISLLEATLINCLSALSEPISILVVGGYKGEMIAEELFRFRTKWLKNRPTQTSVSYKENSHYHTGPQSSLRVGMSNVNCDYPTLILNGDTLYSTPFFRSVACSIHGIRLFCSESHIIDDDDVKVDLCSDRKTIISAQKNLRKRRTISSGALLIASKSDQRLIKRLLLDNVHSGKDNLPWHSLIEQLFQSKNPALLTPVERKSWHEFDCELDIEDYVSGRVLRAEIK